MILESYIDCQSKAVHVLDFGTKDEFDVGRRINNDITVSDISVSRSQATIYKQKKSIFISDCQSKFGTFVLVKGLLPISSKKIIPIQIEKKCFFFTLQ